MAPPPIALPPALPSELLSYVLAQQAHPTTLLICQPRSTFLSSLQRAVRIPPPSPSLPPHSNTANPASRPPPEDPPRHPLLVPTLHQIATSRSIHLVFTPTVTHLRAYLSVLPRADREQKDDGRSLRRQGARGALLVVYGVVGLHRDTSEWSAQGLGNSISACVEAGWRTERRVVVLEERQPDEEDDGGAAVGGERLGDEDDAESPRPRGSGFQVWEERVPMLNGSVRRAGLESQEGGWSGRTVEVGRIVGRWFKFRKGGWESEYGA